MSAPAPVLRHGIDVPGFDDLDRTWLRHRPGAKWHRVAGDVLPAWVADMDYPVPPPVADALRSAVDAGDLGYPDWPDGSPLRRAFARRMSARYGWSPDPSRVREQTDLIQALQLLLHLATAPGDAVAVQTPNYPPFLATLRTMGRQTVPVPWLDTGSSWRMDMAALDRGLARHRCRVLLLVNPHNPTGRVLTRAELDEIAVIARRHDLLVISDEIHSELVHPGHEHVPFASLSEDAARRTVTLTSAGKAFNIAGLRCVVVHYGPDRLLALRDAQPPDLYGAISTLGVTATLAAWEEGDEWQRQLLAVLDRNRRRTCEVLTERLPHLGHHLPEATYLTWIDASALGHDPGPDEPLVERLVREGRVLLDGGPPFGPDAEHHLRLNFATSRTVLEDILDRLCTTAGSTA